MGFSVHLNVQLKFYNLPYLKYLFDRLPNQQNGDIEAFLPWNEKVQRECHA
ncbi:transposase domain-containing protein [Limosilactobacillus reuteri]|nr:transposase domain-containing protein [Limosilactobacillus reuteri]